MDRIITLACKVLLAILALSIPVGFFVQNKMQKNGANPQAATVKESRVDSPECGEYTIELDPRPSTKVEGTGKIKLPPIVAVRHTAQGEQIIDLRTCEPGEILPNR